MTGMLPFVIAGIAALAIVVIAVGIAMTGGGGGMAARLERYASGREPSAASEEEEGQSAVVASISKALEGQDLASRMATDLARADLKMRPAEYLLFWAITPIFFVFAAFLLGFIFPGFRNPVALVAIFLWFYFTAIFYCIAFNYILKSVICITFLLPLKKPQGENQGDKLIIKCIVMIAIDFTFMKLIHFHFIF